MSFRKIPKALREDNYDITVTMFDNKIIDIEPKDTIQIIIMVWQSI